MGPFRKSLKSIAIFPNPHYFLLKLKKVRMSVLTVVKFPNAEKMTSILSNNSLINTPYWKEKNVTSPLYIF